MKSIKQIFIITMMMCFLVFPISVSGVVYVNKNAIGANNGNSWTDAYTTIQAGINDADVADEEVWVAQGTYSTEAITMLSGVKLYGGFNGTETELNQRNWTTNVTTIDVSTARGGLPAYHVVIMSSIINSTIDGFVITGGNANGGTAFDQRGGGFYCLNLDNTNIIANNTILGNSASSYGGGIYCSSSSPIVINNKVSGNLASGSTSNGGGIYLVSSSPTIINNTILGNRANSTFANGGGGIYCSSSSPSIINNIISGNLTSSSFGSNGGGIYCAGSSPTITNNTITENSASVGGGIFCSSNSDPQIKNNIFSTNNTYDIYENDTSSDPIVSYNDFYGNTDGVYVDEGNAPYTIVSAMDSAIAECSNNIGLNPLFVGDTLSGGSWTAAPVYNSTSFQTTLTDSSAVWTPDEHSGRPINPDTSQNRQFVIVSNTATTMMVWGNVTTIAQNGDTYKIFDYHLQLASPCIDAGYDQGVPDSDFDGEPRPMDVPLVDNNGLLEEYDIGADEYPGELPAVSDWALY